MLELEDTPFYPQDKYQCGPASLAMLLGASGVNIQPDALARLIYLPARQGSLQLELISASRQHGLIPYVIDGNISALISELQARRPVLVLQNLGLNIFPAYHYAVVIGLVPPDKIILRSGTTRRLEMDIDHFLATWGRTDFWGMIVLGPSEVPEHLDPARYLDAALSFETSGLIIQAEQAYKAALALWPENQTAMVALGNNYLFQDRYREAASVFRELLMINPEHVAASNNLAEALVQRGCYSQAVSVIDQAVKTAERLHSPLMETVIQTQQEINEQMPQVRSDDDRRCSD
jgi:tetratricopeptide (TPR) repeat protein